jgi:hypothetical protein
LKPAFIQKGNRMPHAIKIVCVATLLALSISVLGPGKAFA